jgi:hypothetical protein
MATHQLDAWFSKRRPLPGPDTLECGMCGGPLLMRWRSGRDAVKITCEQCGRQVDVMRRKHWLVRFRKQDPPPRQR